MSNQNEYRNVDGKEVEITEQMRYDSAYMSLPEFVTYYRTTLGFSVGTNAGSNLRDIFFELRDEMANGRSVNKQLKKSSLVEWRDEIEAEERKNNSKKKKSVEKTKEVLSAATKEVVEESVEEDIEEAVDVDSLSRKEQVEYWLENGLTSTKEIAAKMGANPSYVQRLKKELQDG